MTRSEEGKTNVAGLSDPIDDVGIWVRLTEPTSLIAYMPTWLLKISTVVMSREQGPKHAVVNQQSQGAHQAMEEGSTWPQ